MDYLEGSLLHSWWSDTDYESRKHTGTWLWYSFAFFLVLAYAALRLNLKGSSVLLENSPFLHRLWVLLFFITPLLCAVYYKLPLLLRIPVLSLLAVKYLSFFLSCIGRLSLFFVVPEELTMDKIMVWGNKTFGLFLEDTTSRLGVTGLFVGGAILVLIGIGLALIMLALVIFVPILLLKGFNAFQFLWDSLLMYLFRLCKRLYKSYRSDPGSKKAENVSAGKKSAAAEKS